jgi:hypothetical protein
MDSESIFLFFDAHLLAVHHGAASMWIVVLLCFASSLPALAFFISFMCIVGFSSSSGLLTHSSTQPTG